MRFAALSLVAAITCPGALAHAAKPQGQNCSLIAPPKSSGETASHGAVIRLYPRRSEMAADYTGCQAMFVGPPGGPYELAMLVEFSRGKLTKAWTPPGVEGDLASCKYRDGEPIRDGPAQCPSGEDFPMPSLPAGCLEREWSKEDKYCELDQDLPGWKR